MHKQYVNIGATGIYIHVNLIILYSSYLSFKVDCKIMISVDHGVEELTSDLEKVNRRYRQILEGINQIFSNVVQAKTEEELGNACLSVALKVTGSLIGFVNLMDADGILHEIAIHDMEWGQCRMYGKIGHRRHMGEFVVHSFDIN